MPRLFFELARRGYRRYAAYPGATWAGVFTNTVFGLITAYVFVAVFRERDTVGSYDARDAVTYVWLASGLLMTVYLWGWHEVALRVRSGDVATDLQRPLDLQVYWLAQDLGRAVYHGIFRGGSLSERTGLLLARPLPEKERGGVVHDVSGHRGEDTARPRAEKAEQEARPDGPHRPHEVPAVGADV